MLKFKEVFAHHLNQTKKTNIYCYPKKVEYEEEIKNTSEFINKTVEQLRSKLQHEFKLSLINKQKHELESMDDSEDDSEIKSP